MHSCVYLFSIDSVFNYVTLELEKEAIYDREAGLFVMYFTDHEIWYPADASCYVGMIADDGASSVRGTPDFDAYPDVVVDNTNYCGIAIKLDEDLPAGDYTMSITFDVYIVSFDYTIQ